MAINGVETLRFGVKDPDLCIRFFEDFGFSIDHRDTDSAVFVLDEGSKVEIRRADDSTLPRGKVEGFGVREIVWGVDTQENFSRLVTDLSRDHELQQRDDGAVHFVPNFGIPMALRVFAKRPIVYAPEPLNAAGSVKRLNAPRKWRKRAHPKVIQHVVFQSADHEAAVAFMCDRLGFRITDVQEGYGTYVRAGGTNLHHNFMLFNANAPLPDCDGKTRFHHANFGVEDLDEMMLGANHMERRGWGASHIGLGRHRVDSALFYYLPFPGGGEIEYGADSDCVDDNWVPRRFINPLFGYAHFTHNIPPFLKDPPDWRFAYLEQKSEEPRHAKDRQS
jgi:catechol 2,3-dioxygenase-like lactoylglutathione lyase family enzyme